MSSPANVPTETPRRADFAAWVTLGTRWGDNDVYGHVNNVQYYAFFDTAVNQYLIAQGVLSPNTSPQIGLVVHSSCNFFAPLSFPQSLDIGLRVLHLGRSSVRYQIGVFDALGAAQPEVAAGLKPSAVGEFVHVYVNRQSRQPEAIAPDTRRVLEQLQRAEASVEAYDPASVASLGALKP